MENDNYYKFLDSLEDLGLITQEEGKDITEVRIKREIGKNPIVEIVYELRVEEE